MRILDGNFCLAMKDLLGVAAASAGLRRALNAIARRTAKALQANGCTIFLLDPSREFLVPSGYYGLTDVFLHKGSLSAGRSIPKIMDGKVVAVFDVATDSRIEYPEAARQEKIASLLGVPVLNKGGAVAGEMRIYCREHHRFSAIEKDFALAAANIVSLVLEKTEMERALAGAQQAPAVSFAVGGTGVRPAPVFGHPSEAEFARLLDFYRIEWLYEPRSFALKVEAGKPVEMFTPDFYLPEMDLYIELTTLKQNLITEKNHKIRMLRELYPDIKIRLLNKSDYRRLLAKYGYGPLAEAKVHGVTRVLFSRTQVQRRVAVLAQLISKDYAGQSLVLVGVLKGVLCFMSDLMQHISLPVTIDFMATSAFAVDAEKTVSVTKDLDVDITGKHVLMVEDIVDTGMTLNYVLDHLREKSPASLKVCALLDKKARRLIDVPLDYVGFEIPDEFVVGYGLDYGGEYRNLPFIGALAAEALPSGQKESPK